MPSDAMSAQIKTTNKNERLFSILFSVSGELYTHSKIKSLGEMGNYRDATVDPFMFYFVNEDIALRVQLHSKDVGSNAFEATADFVNYAQMHVEEKMLMRRHDQPPMWFDPKNLIENVFKRTFSSDLELAKALVPIIKEMQELLGSANNAKDIDASEHNPD